MIVEIRYRGDSYLRYPVITDDPDQYHWRCGKKINISSYKGGFDGVLRYFQRVHFKGHVTFITDKPFNKQDWI